MAEIASDLAPFDFSAQLQSLELISDKDIFYWTHWHPRDWKYYIIKPGFTPTVNTYIVSISFTLIYIAHMWMMIGPLQFWCSGNWLLYWFSVYTGFQLLISYAYAFESPIFLNLDSKARWVPIIIGLVSGGMWVV